MRTLRVALVATLTMLGVLGGVALGDGRAGEINPDIARVLELPDFAQATWGILQVDAVSGMATQALNADRMFLPGSTAKVLSVSAVWKILGPDRRFATPVYAIGSRSGGRLVGSLVLVGSGDLTLGGRSKADGSVNWTNTDHVDANAIPGVTLTPEDPLAGIKSLAAQVRASGITEVWGDVVVDDRLFSSDLEPRPTPVMINDNLIDLVIAPTAPGDDATVTFRPLSSSYSVEAKVRTVAEGQVAQLTVTGAAPGKIVVEGTIAAGSVPIVRVAPIDHIAVFARAAFIEALRAAGVAVSATGEVNDRALLPSSYPRAAQVAVYHSPPYAEYAKLILKVSHNLGANLGLCLLAVEKGSSNCEDGFSSIGQFLTSAGVDVAQVVLVDAEGGPGDRATPKAFTQLLRYWTTQPDFDAFRQCLPILGVDGSLAAVAVDSPARGKVFAKTGTNVGADALGQRLFVQAKSLAGFFEAADGGWQAFNVVVNNGGGSPDIGGVLRANEHVGRVAAQLWQLSNR